MSSNIIIREASSDDLHVIVGILAIAGEHMHRVQGKSHWYPYRSSDVFAKRLKGRTSYLVELDGLVIGTFDLSLNPELYHEMNQWPDGDVPAVYFGGFALLPAYWGNGFGSAIIEYAKATARTMEPDRFRFDGVSSNEILIRWYQSLGFTKTGKTQVGDVEVTCFEMLLSE